LIDFTQPILKANQELQSVNFKHDSSLYFPKAPNTGKQMAGLLTCPDRESLPISLSADSGLFLLIFWPATWLTGLHSSGYCPRF